MDQPDPSAGSTPAQPEVVILENEPASDPPNPDPPNPAPNPAEPENGTTASARKRSSRAWQVFEIVNLKNPKNPAETIERARCRQCGADLCSQTSNGTKHLLRHIETCSKRLKIESTQTRIGRLATGGISSFQFTQSNARKWMIKLVIVRELPFQFIDDPVVQRCINQGFQPAFRRISRNTVRSDVLKYYSEEKQVLKTVLLDCPGKLSFTSDIWQSKQNLSYLSLTAHYIDHDWVLNKKILAYTLIDKAHTGENIADLIGRKLSDWGVDRKVFCLSLDNASSNNASVDRLKAILPSLPLYGDLFHVRCCCHILNLVVQDGLKVEQFKDMLKHLKGNLEYIFISGTRYSQFRSLCKENGLKARKLQLDVKHRWNSTYLMLKGAVPYRSVITSFLTDRACPFKLTDDDWKYAELLCKFLKPFYDATNHFSGVDYVTTNSVLRYLFAIGKVFDEHRRNEDFRSIIYAMEAKFVKYWGETPILFGLACILDPRVNVKGIESVLKDVEKCFASSAYGIRCSTSQSAVIVSNLRSLFAEYTSNLNEALSANAFAVASSSNGGAASSSNGGGAATAPPSFCADDAGDCEDEDAYWNSIGRQSTNPLESASEELSRYFSEPKPSSDPSKPKFEILHWWKENENRYPVLSTVARDVLAVPVSTVASESAFSCGKRVLGDYRSNLTPDMLECCVVLKDWWRHEMKDDYVPYNPLNEDITPVEETGHMPTDF